MWKKMTVLAGILILSWSFNPALGGQKPSIQDGGSKTTNQAMMATKPVTNAGGQLPDRFLAEPWVLKDPETKETLALVSYHNETLAGGTNSPINHRTTYYVRLWQMTPHVPDDRDRSLIPKVTAGEVKLKESEASRLAREDLFTDQKGALRAYRFQDPKTKESLLLVVNQDQAQVFQGDFVFNLSDRSLVDWLLEPKKDPQAVVNQESSYSVTWGPSSIVGGQLADLILQQWNGKDSPKYPDGSSTKNVYDLFVPFKRGFFAFEAKRLSLQNGNTRIKVSASNWIIKPFAPEILFTFRCETGDFNCEKKPRILSYRGPSPIEINGSRYPTVILEAGTPEGAGA